MLLVSLLVLLVATIGAGRWGRTYYGRVSWVPAAVVVGLALLLLVTGNFTFR